MLRRMLFASVVVTLHLGPITVAGVGVLERVGTGIRLHFAGLRVAVMSVLVAAFLPKYSES